MKQGGAPISQINHNAMLPLGTYYEVNKQELQEMHHDDFSVFI